MAQSILKYLKKVQELEGTIYTMDRMTTQLADQALQLGRKQRIELPSPRTSNRSIRPCLKNKGCTKGRDM